jgi:predicted RNase H-like HicB family nuclease
MESRAATLRYRVSLHRVRGTWLAHVIDLPGCAARGVTEVEALENAREAIRAYHRIAQALAADPARIVLEIGA